MDDPVVTLIANAVVYFFLGALAYRVWHTDQITDVQHRARLALENAEKLHAAAERRLKCIPAPEQYDNDRRKP